MKTLTDKSYWRKRLGKIKVTNCPASNYAYYIDKYLPKGKGKTCLEIGAYPGYNLVDVARRLGCTPIALDYQPETSEIEKLMKCNGLKSYEVIITDFLTWETRRYFDMVMSFGLVEHFTNYEEVIRKQMALVKSEGYLVISVPYLSPFQTGIRKLFYTPEKFQQVMTILNLKIMDLRELERCVLSTGEFRKIFSGYIRGMTVWFGLDERGVRRDLNYLYQVIKAGERVVNNLGINNCFISPEILIIARKI